MKIINVEQGSLPWLQARLGIPCASEAHKVVTPTGKLSKQSKCFAYRLVAERFLKRPLLGELDHIDSIASGKQLEGEAVSYFELDREVDTVKAGFFTTDNGRVGASPDRLVGDNGLLEAKCPLPQTQIGYLVDGPSTDYRVQMMCQLYVTEREFVEFMAYSRELPSLIIRYDRDEAFIAKLRDALDEFTDMLDEMTHKAISLGAVIKPPRIAESLSGTCEPSGEETIAMLDAALRMYAP